MSPNFFELHSREIVEVCAMWGLTAVIFGIYVVALAALIYSTMKRVFRQEFLKFARQRLTAAQAVPEVENYSSAKRAIRHV